MPKMKKHLFAEVGKMDINTGDLLEMKKSHPCGGFNMMVLRVGADFRLKCEKCGHIYMIPRAKCEKKIKNIIRKGTDNA